MTLLHRWSHPTTPAGVGWDIVQSGVVRLSTEKGFSARAALGEAEVIRVIVDDPTGIAEYKTLHRWYMVEDETDGDQLVWNGYISDQYVGRTADGEVLYPTGTGRVWELEITQENTLLGFRVVQGTATAASGVRPEERPSARLNWLLASSFLSTVHDHGLIDWANLADGDLMDAIDYRGQTAGDVLRDISLKTGFNHYARYRDASADIELAFYGSGNSTLDLSSLKISNAPADLSATGDFDTPLIYAPSEDARLHRKGDRVAAGVLVQGAGGIQSYGYDLDTSYEFGFRDMVVSDNNTTTQAQADALRNRILADHDEQDERVTARIQVAAAQLNAVKHGQLMSAKFTHFPGWTSYRPCRVVSKSFSRPANETQAKYDVDLELSPQRDVAICSDGACQRFNINYNVTIPGCVSHGDVLILCVNARGFSGLATVGPEAWTLAARVDAYNGAQYTGPGPNVSLDVFYRTWSTGDSATVTVSPGQNGTNAWITVLPTGTVSTPTVTSGTITAIKGQALSIGPTAGPGFLWGVWSIQRDDGQSGQTGLLISSTGNSTTISPNQPNWDGDCGVSWGPRRWIGYIERETGSLTLTASLASPSFTENLFEMGWVGLYFPV